MCPKTDALQDVFEHITGNISLYITPFTVALKDQCVTMRGMYWQKLNIILVSMVSLVYNQLIIRIVFVILE